MIYKCSKTVTLSAVEMFFILRFLDCTRNDKIFNFLDCKVPAKTGIYPLGKDTVNIVPLSFSETKVILPL